MNTFSQNETIVALSTPVGSGAIAIVRLSGPKVRQIINKIFISKSSSKKLPTKTPVLGNFIDIDGEIFDEGQVVFYENPNSYTGEDLGELFCHGSAAIYQFLIESACSAGARIANPGEFTRRAFLEGKIDLVQSESVADLISSETKASAKIALSQLQGNLSNRLEEIWEKIVEIGAHLEASIEFPDEFEPGAGPLVQERPLQGSELASFFTNAENSLKELQDSFRSGKILRDGARVAIIGKPNAGKSTLLNNLLGEERSITSDIPGTTRDTVEEVCDVGGIPVRFIATAGLRNASDPIEQEGTKRAYNAAEVAELCLLVLDASKGENELIWAEKEAKKIDTKKLFVVNKIDLLPLGFSSKTSSCISKISISALHKKGLDSLRNSIFEILTGENPESSSSEHVILTNERHKNLVSKARECLGQAFVLCSKGYSPELVAVHLNDSSAALSEILGKSYGESLLDKIFLEFCIGK